MPRRIRQSRAAAVAAHLPEHPEKPVIDGSKDARHGGDWKWWSEAIGSRSVEEKEGRKKENKKTDKKSLDPSAMQPPLLLSLSAGREHR